MTEQIQSSTTPNQADYLKLFMQELTYQDPLKPIDNREFMAQMAQFSMLQQTQETNELLGGLLGITDANRSLMMLGKQVKLKGSEDWGNVRKIEFHDDASLIVHIDMKGDSIKAQLQDISEVI